MQNSRMQILVHRLFARVIHMSSEIATHSLRASFHEACEGQGFRGFFARLTFSSGDFAECPPFDKFPPSKNLLGHFIAPLSPWRPFTIPRHFFSTFTRSFALSGSPIIRSCMSQDKPKHAQRIIST